MCIICKFKCVCGLCCVQIGNACSTLGSPQIKEDVTGDEIQSKFWCYFCSVEVQKHLIFDGRSYLANAGLLEHISRLLLITDFNCYFTC